MRDVYIVTHVATTCDEHGVYVTKDSCEVIELAWIVVNAKTLEEIHRESTLVRPVNTPITALCTSLTTLTWEHVRNAGNFRDAITAFDRFAQDYLIANGYDFTFVTLNAWDIRVQIPREARDKSVILPPYLQHPKAFDLRMEYSRWQAHHPEYIHYPPSSLSSICTALEVESVQTSAPIKHNLPFHLQALAPAAPRRAMEEAITLARVLKALIRKSVPIEQHLDVLTRPLDAKADVRAFLSERSKILYLSNLPHDTTQSELESWFTQYGGRPIAFWTLRTADQHKPSGTGFAVFSSHEEAAESLAMNGRALNERAIEVAPSGNTVLERANDILTPFPPSKNRPRPGDWTCPSCGFSNFQRRTACFRCSYPAMSAASLQDPGYNMYGNYHSQHTAALNGNNTGASPQQQAIISGLNNSSNSLPPQPNKSHHNSIGNGGGANITHNNVNVNNNGNNAVNNLHSNLAGNPNLNGGGINRGMGSVPFRAGDWKCGNEGCNYHNFAKNVSCLRCGASRVSAAIISGGDMSNNSVYIHGQMNNNIKMVNQHPSLGVDMNSNNGNGNNISNGPSLSPSHQPYYAHQLQQNLQYGLAGSTGGIGAPGNGVGSSQHQINSINSGIVRPYSAQSQLQHGSSPHISFYQQYSARSEQHFSPMFNADNTTKKLYMSNPLTHVDDDYGSLSESIDSLSLSTELPKKS